MTPPLEIEISQVHQIEVLWNSEMNLFNGLPVRERIVDWAIHALLYLDCPASEVAIKIVSSEEMRDLNANYRHQHKPTNVLSFPSQAMVDEGRQLLGDIAVCADVIRFEAETQGKHFNAHFAHMVVHGVLHLYGYEHEGNRQAAEMEQIETEILRTIGFPDPYLAT